MVGASQGRPHGGATWRESMNSFLAVLVQACRQEHAVEDGEVCLGGRARVRGRGKEIRHVWLGVLRLPQHEVREGSTVASFLV